MSIAIVTDVHVYKWRVSIEDSHPWINLDPRQPHSPYSIQGYLCARPSLACTTPSTPVHAALTHRPHPIHTMSTPTSSDLFAVIESLQCSMLSLEDQLGCMESADQAHIASISTSAMPTSPPSTSTPGKGQAKAAPASVKAKSAKQKGSTKKASIPSDALPLHLTQTFPQEGKPNRHLVTVAIPDATAAYVIGCRGKGLKQLHNISGTWVSAYTLTSGLHNERHVSIRGTDEQISDALVVLGKWMAHKRVCGPPAKKPAPPAPTPANSATHAAPHSFGALGPSLPAPTPQHSYQPAPPLHPPLPQQGLPTPMFVPTPPKRTHSILPTTPLVPTIIMASPSPSSTPYAPTVIIGSPLSSGTPTLTLMQVDVMHTSTLPTPDPRYMAEPEGQLWVQAVVHGGPPTPRPHQTVCHGGRGTFGS